MSSHSVHLIGREEEGEEEEYRQMEIASARPEVRSPLTHPSSVLETLLTGLDRKLIDLVIGQTEIVSRQAGQSAELPGVIERLERVETSLHGSARGSPNPGLWTSRPEGASFIDAAPSASGIHSVTAKPRLHLFPF